MDGNLRDLLIFSHANGFPGQVYQVMLDSLRARFEVSAVARFGHEPRFPVGRGWPKLVDELAEHVHAANGHRRRVWLVGHSLGGYVSVLAAERLGSHVAGIVLLDSPLITGLGARLIKFGRHTGLDRHFMPLEQTLQRRVHWPDIDAAHGHFAAKAAFAHWDPRVLRDYAEFGTEPADGGGRSLLFDREVEHSIYRTLPTTSIAAVARRLSVPVAFIAGTRSREVRYIGLRATRRVVGDRIAWIEGSHLFPMERPEETAVNIATAIDGISSLAAAQTA